MDSIDAAELALSLPEVDPGRPSVARIYDFWLGGSQNFEADREAGRRAAEAMPMLPTWARANRVFLRHVVGELAGRYGIRQFLDLGSGVPTVGNVHEMAQSADPGATVVYIDMDPVAIAHARALLADNPTAHAALADLREPRVVLEHPVVRDSIDWGKPVAVLMFAVLHFIADDAEAGRIVRAFTEPCAPGSYLAISHGGFDHTDLRAQQNAARGYVKVTGVPFTPRAAEQVAPWLDGLEIMPPGLANIDVWLPSLCAGGNPPPSSLGVLARKGAAAGS